MQVVLATGNKGKVVEIKALLASLPIELIEQSRFNIEDADETGTTYIENAIIKARHAAKCSGMPALADDSGLSIAALNGAPGVYSSRYAGPHANDHDRCQKVLTELQDVPDEKRDAAFHCVMAFCRNADDPAPIISHGIWPGKILREMRGNNGFGYDPIFYVEKYHCSAAELDNDTKNKISHRGRAMTDFIKAIQSI